MYNINYISDAWIGSDVHMPLQTCAVMREAIQMWYRNKHYTYVCVCVPLLLNLIAS